MDFMLIKTQSLNYTSIILKLHNRTKPSRITVRFRKSGREVALLEGVTSRSLSCTSALLVHTVLTELWLHVRRAPPHRRGPATVCQCQSSRLRQNRQVLISQKLKVPVYTAGHPSTSFFTSLKTKVFF